MQRLVDKRERELSHDRLAKRPAVFVDGHAAALPSTRAYWYDGKDRYTPGGSHGGVYDLYSREVKHFMFFIEPGDYVDAGGDP